MNAVSHRFCVAPVKDWLDAARIIEGPVFRPISKADRIPPRALTDRQIARIVKEQVEIANIDPDRSKRFSGH